MKKYLIVMVFGTCLVLHGYGQGSLLFNNVYFQTLPGSAPVTITTVSGMFNPANGSAGAYLGSNYTASLFFVGGTVDTQWVFDSLNPIWAADAPFYGTTGLGPAHGPTADGAGLFDGGEVVLSPTPGLQATIQVRAWYNGSGLFTSYSQAVAAGQNVGLSNLVPILLGLSPGPSPTLDGLLPFTVGIPEPSTFVLAALGSAAWLLFRRRK